MDIYQLIHLLHKFLGRRRQFSLKCVGILGIDKPRPVGVVDHSEPGDKLEFSSSACKGRLRKKVRKATMLRPPKIAVTGHWARDPR